MAVITSPTASSGCPLLVATAFSASTSTPSEPDARRITTTSSVLAAASLPFRRTCGCSCGCSCGCGCCCCDEGRGERCAPLLSAEQPAGSCGRDARRRGEEPWRRGEATPFCRGEARAEPGGHVLEALRGEAAAAVKAVWPLMCTSSRRVPDQRAATSARDGGHKAESALCSCWAGICPWRRGPGERSRWPGSRSWRGCNALTCVPSIGSGGGAYATG